MFSTLGVSILCFVLGIMTLTIFFRVMNMLRWSGPTPKVPLISLLDKDAWLTIHMAGSDVYERVRIVGITNHEMGKGDYFTDLANMIMIETEQGTRTLIRAKSITKIEVLPK